ncbi:MAG: hypothetical protein V2A54_09185 [Bacteroidota bacterium]
MISKFSYRLFFVVFSLFWMNLLYAQDIRVSSRISNNKILIGDHVIFELNVQCPKEYLIGWPRPYDSLSPQLQILGRTTIDTLITDNKNTLNLNQRFLITSYDSGTWAVPIFEFLFKKQSDTNLIKALTNPLILYVNTVPVDTTKDFREIKGPLGVPWSWKEALPYIYIAVGAILVTILTIIIIRRIRSKKPLFRRDSKPRLKPHVLALQNLNKLKEEKLWQKEQVKQYYSQLSDITRTYLEEQFGFAAMEMITDDIIKSFNKLGLQETLNDRLEKLLRLSDLVKFAKVRPLPSDHEYALETAFQIVLETMPVEEEENEKNNHKPEQE